MTHQTELVIQIMASLLTLIAMVIAAYQKKQTESHATTAKAKAYEILLGLAATATQDAVRIVDELKKSGNWNSETKAAVKNQVIGFVADLGKDELPIVLGAVHGATSVPDFLSKLIEGQVQAAKTGMTIPPPAAKEA